MKLKFSLKNKIFAAILCVLIFNIILSVILGTTLFDRLYTNDKINMLKNGVNNIKSTYLTKNLNRTIDEIIKYETQNMTICIFTLDTATGLGEIEYYSRQRYFSLNPFDNEILATINGLYGDNSFNELDKSNFYIKNIETGRKETNIAVLSKIEPRRFILVQTPIKFIQDISYSAIKYSVIISMFSLLIAAVITYFVADRTTRPIRQLQLVADKISKLDFSERCSSHSKDEVGLLSSSINNMADKLQEYVTKLKDDLIKLEKADKMTKQFIANVSHDFKTPLTLIMSYSEALLDLEDIDEKTKNEYLDIIISEGNKLSLFVHELLKLSQLEGGIIKLEMSNFSINEIIEDTIGKNDILTKDKCIAVQKEIDDNSIVFADYFRIEQVFQNLYENAVKYCVPSGIIRVKTRVMGNKCRISIFNTGSPIADEDIENIFISFYRADKSRKNLGSYGLGLAIVKAVMDMHNESYGVQNTEGGVEFWFELCNVEMSSELEE